MFMVGQRRVDLEAVFIEAEQLFVLPSTIAYTMRESQPHRFVSCNCVPVNTCAKYDGVCVDFNLKTGCDSMVELLE